MGYHSWAHHFDPHNRIEYDTHHIVSRSQYILHCCTGIDPQSTDLHMESITPSIYMSEQTFTSHKKQLK